MTLTFTWWPSYTNLRYQDILAQQKWTFCVKTFESYKLIVLQTDRLTWCVNWEHIRSALRQLHWLPVHRRVDFKISTLVYRSLAGTSPVYLARECTLVTAAAGRVLCGLLTIEHAWSRDHATSSVTAVLPPPGQRCGTVCLNSFSNRTSPLDNSNDRWKRLCLVTCRPRRSVSER